MKIYLIRHTAVDVSGICYGQSNVPLKDTFEIEAKSVCDKLKSIAYDAVYSSPLDRCTRLANFCGYEDKIVLDNRLKELNFGEWELQKWEDIDMTIWEKDWIYTPTPQGESFAKMYDRVSSFFDEIKKLNYDNILVFTHGGVINCARVYFGLATLERTFEKKNNYGEIIEFDL